MPDEPTTVPPYVLGQLERAIRGAADSGSAEDRKRAEAKVARWRQVLTGTLDGRLEHGSRTPVAGTPSWVTLEVAHGGFATGGYSAETPLTEGETELLRSLPADAPGVTDRERVNLWYLSDPGQDTLRELLRVGSYRIEFPEDAALPTVAWLMQRGHHELALDLATELRPWMGRLRMAPLRQESAELAGIVVRLETVAEVARSLRAKQVPQQVGLMRDTLTVWHPLYDRLVALWCETVDGALPELSDGAVTGGWPCRLWPEGWAQRRREWLGEFHLAGLHHEMPSGARQAKGNFARLRLALETCGDDGAALTGREVGWVRRSLANTVGRRGAPESSRRTDLRARQAAEAALPTTAGLAALVAQRLERYPLDGGIADTAPVAVVATEGEAAEVPAGWPIPKELVAKSARALEAPVDELVARGVITSGDVLARVLPQITAQLLAASISDAELGTLYGRAYAAFRRRRSLLLLNLEHQVRFGELPWVAAIGAFRTRRPEDKETAAQTARQATLLALSAFPQAILPNPLLRELRTLTQRAGISVPVVDEIAADIFMGVFTEKWRTAAALAGELLEGTLYANYYDLPHAGTWREPEEGLVARVTRRLGRETVQNFGKLCGERAREAQQDGNENPFGSVARNGTILEQSQILTTQNLATLVRALDLGPRITELAPDLARRALHWVVRRQEMKVDDRFAALQLVKNCAYAWRQAVFFLSFCELDEQRAVVDELRELLAQSPARERLEPAVLGLERVVEGARFADDGTIGHGRRFLGWTVGSHWLLAAQRREGRG